VWYSECPRAVTPVAWRAPAMECALSAGSQLSAHALCLFAAISNVVVGGVSIASGHGVWPTVAFGTSIYLASIAVRWLWRRDDRLPSLPMAAIGLAIGIALSAGLGMARDYNHRNELANWYAGLSGSERQEVRSSARRWFDGQSAAQRESLAIVAQIAGYETPEEYIILNSCSSSNRRTKASWDSVADTGLPGR
jgi:hypothetical protein